MHANPETLTSENPSFFIQSRPAAAAVATSAANFLFSYPVWSREQLGLGVKDTLRSDFFREEYVLDYRLANIAKEQVIASNKKPTSPMYKLPVKASS